MIIQQIVVFILYFNYSEYIFKLYKYNKEQLKDKGIILYSDQD